MLTYWHVATSEYCTYLDTRGLLQRALLKPDLQQKDRIPQGVFGVASLALYASAPNHVFGQMLGLPGSYVLVPYVPLYRLR